MGNLLIKKQITVSTDAYTAGDSIGGLQTIAAATIEKPSEQVVNAITVADKAGQKAAFNIIFFKAEPATVGTVITDNDALDLADADLLKVVGYVGITAADYIDFVDNSLACVSSIGLPIDSDDEFLYFAIQAVGTPTYAAVSDLQITIGLL